MIFTDESTIKVDKTVLPGLFKSIEITGAAMVDEQEVQGQTKKPKQVTGYEDGKVNIELILEDGPLLTIMEKLTVIQNLFRKPGQEKPVVHEIINRHTAARGIKKVIFKDLTTKQENKKSQLAATLVFWEHSVMTITATKSGGAGAGSGSSPGSNLNQDYQDYLNNSRGSAPGASSPAQDTDSGSQYLGGVGNLPY